ncbi:thioredoxin family protein [Vibrio porteresiae]|uniref:Thioredoxin family protein n=1 Tax=Vibrio porteresiae DSM 19223 TaxID=1123496 RepID=A0ABZ0QHX3_9VIBR|nr:thioredoxin family protein [Vibrio porteresiae]WPC76054.1 thioredoxin family protein [Vibrio porteresiae DSM 19223]
MLLKRVLLLPLLLLSFMAFATQDKVYDPSRDAYTDYLNALTIAKKDHKNIFVVAGGNWCPYCVKFEKNLKETALDKVIEHDYVFMKANFSNENDNHTFFNLFPKFNAYPHIMIISSNGELLLSQPMVLTEQQFRDVLKKYTI